MQNEKDLLNSVINSDQDAFRKLSEIYYDPLYRFIWRKTRNAEMAKDLVQELFLNVWKLRKQIDPARSFKAYLYSAANNLTINYFKSTGRKQKYFTETDPAETSAIHTDPAEFQEYLEDVLNGLPEEQKTVFILNKFEGFKYEEIAKTLNISVKTVESRMGKILKVLRDKLSLFLVLLLLLFGG